MIKLEIKHAEIDAIAARIRKLGGDLTPAMREVGEYLTRSTKRVPHTRGDEPKKHHLLFQPPRTPSDHLFPGRFAKLYLAVNSRNAFREGMTRRRTVDPTHGSRDEVCNQYDFQR